MKRSLIQNIYSLSPTQEGILFHSQLSEDSSVYFEQVRLDLEGTIDRSIFQQSMQKLIERHDVLRTVFTFKKTQKPRQVVLKERHIVLHYQDFSCCEEESEDRIECYLEQNPREGLDLSKDLLMRVALFKTGAASHTVIWSFHHIVMDGWCFGILIRDFVQIYHCLMSGRSYQVPSPPPYSDYVSWFERQNHSAALDFWREYLDGYENAASLPKKDSPLLAAAYRQRSITLEFEDHLNREIIEFCKQSEVTLHTFYSGLWGLVQHCFNDRGDAVFGNVVAGRPAELADSQNMVGLFINTIPLRVTVKSDESFLQLLKRLSCLAMDWKRFEFVSLADIQRESILKQTLFDHIFGVENFPLKETIQQASKQLDIGFGITGISVLEQTSYDLNIMVNAGFDTRMYFIYNKIVYESAVVQSAATRIHWLARQLTAHPNRPLSKCQWVTPEEKEKILNEFNDTRKESPPAWGVLERLIHYMDTTPDHAVSLDSYESKDVRYPFSRTMSYGFFRECACRVASKLKELGLEPGDIAAVIAQRGFECLVGMTAIFCAGGVYLPLDPNMPEERIECMLKDSGARILLSGRSNNASPAGLHLLELQAAIGSFDGYSFGACAPEAGNPAYVIYTSGSSGTPKGVMISHGSLSNYLFGAYLAFEEDFSLRDRGLCQSGICFDVSTVEMFLPLCFGGSLVLVPGDWNYDPALVGEAILKTAATFSMIPPSLLKDVCDYLLQAGRVASLDKLLTGLELIEDSTLERFFGVNPRMKMINGYGPTETTICATMYRYEGGNPRQRHIPIGTPMANVQAVILDMQRRIVPVGVPGEIYIGGFGVGMGYLNRPELTQQRFIEDLDSLNQGCWYRTGDLGCFLEDGNIRFLGRNDRQVKIRGYRVELGEIERRLRLYRHIKNAVILVKTGMPGIPFLCAYLIPEGEDDIDYDDLRSFLRQWLPEYMIPAQFIRIQEIPLTANGKIDHKHLPEPGIGDGRRKILPEDPIGKTLAAIWSDLLGIPEEVIGIDDHFFYLGGHSLTISRMTARIHQELGVALPLRQVMAQPFIRSISALVQATNHQSLPSIVNIEKMDYYPLSHSQRSQFALHQQYPLSTNYNISHALEVKGRLQREKIERAFVALIRRHESLRTSFHIVAGQPAQRICPLVDFSLQDLELPPDGRIASIASIIEAFIEPFSLERAPLLRVGTASLTEERHLLLVDMHHIIADGFSAAILVREWLDLYCGKTLPELEVQYKDYACWVAEMQTSGELTRQLNYWQNQFTPLPPPLELPKETSANGSQGSLGRVEALELGRDESLALLAWCRDNDCTLFMAVSAMVAILLSRLGEVDDVVIGIPESGRCHPALDSVIGMFVNTLPLRFRFRDSFTYRNIVEYAKKTVAEALQHRDVAFVDLVRLLGLQGRSSGNPLFDVMLTMENIAMPSLSLPDLEINLIDSGGNDVKFDLLIAVQQREERLIFRFHYAAASFNGGTIRRWLGYLQRIIDRFIWEPDISPAKIEIFGAYEKEKLLNYLTGPSSRLPFEATIVDLFCNRVRANAGRIALVQSEEGNHVTYGCMGEEVNRRAAALRGRGVGRDSIVAIVADRSFEVMIGIFSILSSGAAYLPLDASLPDERLNFIITDSQPALVLGRDYDTELPFDHDSEYSHYEALGLKPQDLAYIMYTSGSTGKPKASMIDHRCVVRVVADSDYMQFTPDDRVLQLSTTAFDGSVFDIFGALLNGGALVLLEQKTILSPQALGCCILREAVTTFFMTAALFNVMVEEALDSFRWIRVIAFGGEQASVHHVQKAFDYLGPGRLINGYGPTESTVFAVCRRMDTMEGCDRHIPIGKPITNTFLRIVDRHMRQTPIGVPGELLIGGSGLGRGYMNRQELTEERFVTIDDSISGRQSRFYRSGDLTRLRDDGDIEFLGRLDDQLKIRGFRIEPGEIENCLCNHPSIQEAVVVPYTPGEGNTMLTAYIVAGPGGIPSPARVIEYLRRHLPAYMIPTHIIPIGKIPLNSNGKVDRRSLPAPRKDSSEASLPPQTELQKRLAVIWNSALSIAGSEPGLDDDFFASGGHSLSAAVLMKRISEEFKATIPLVDFLQCPTIRNLDSLLQNNTQEKSHPKTVMLRAGDPDEPAFFFVHAGSGCVDGYAELCKQMASPSVCWGIRVAMEEFLYPRNIEVVDLASEYIGIIRGIQPSGPYRLAGWCVGGTIAFEMALQLQEAGLEVESLIMINSAAPGTFPADRSRAFTLESELRLLENIQGNTSSSSSLTMLWDDLRGKIADAVSLATWIPSGWRRALPEPESVSREEYLRFIFVARSLDRARAAYTPSGEFKRMIHFISAEESRLEDTNLWQKYCFEPLQCLEVPGDHFSMFSHPHVTALSEAIDTVMAMEENL